ncbi:endoglucanase 18-like [Canna indica]|uniref:Endoglucanase n=1 Tax=Canna indica TaxID=4628 RepID=A0AAQ3JLV4_9LILI|nr:endoglucanase 18-like [Canna indica]
MYKEEVSLVAKLLLCAMALGWCAEAASTASHNYSDALGKAILFFEGQRSGELPLSQRVKWRGDSALTDGQLDHVNLRGGYYDAGDNVKFGWPMSFSVTLLSWAGIHYGRLLSPAGHLGHLRSAIRWGADFTLRAHVNSTTLYTQVGDGNADHECWERPEDMDTPRTLYKISKSSPGTEAAADAAAALASAYLVFRRGRPKFAAKLLVHSRSLFEFANKYRGSYTGSCPFYCSSGYQDELLWAAAWLFKATKSPKYLRFVIDNQVWSQPASEFSWDSKIVGVQTLLAKEYLAVKNKELAEYKTQADSFVCAVMPKSGHVQVQTTPGGLLFTRDAANLQYVSSAALLLLIYSNTLQSAGVNAVHCSSAEFSTHQISSFAKSQVDYILGKNPLGFSYMVGYGDKYPKRIHHRGASVPSVKKLPRKVTCKEGYTSWFSTADPNPNSHVGAIVGGPNSNDWFDDVRSDSVHSEPTTYINAAFVGAAAALLDEHSFLEITSDIDGGKLIDV